MKTRFGFVSNSSSSSFIIGILDEHVVDDVCPTCGTHTSDLRSAIDKAQKYDYNNEIEWEGLDNYIDLLNENIISLQNNINNQRGRSSEEIVSEWSRGYTVGEYISDLNQEIEELQGRIKLAEEWRNTYKSVIGIGVSNHDNVLMDTIRSLVKLNKIVLLPDGE